MYDTYLTVPIERGCGERQDDGVYACTGMDPEGSPVEDFVVDPAIEWIGGPFRAPKLIEDPKEAGVFHMAIWVGQEFYPWPSDFIEEVRIAGVSRRIPKGFPLERLTAGKSKMFFIHARVFPCFSFEIREESQSRGRCKRIDHEGRICTFALWDLSALEHIPERHALSRAGQNLVDVNCPSFRYQVSAPMLPEANTSITERELTPAQRFDPGIFAAFWLTHLEHVRPDPETQEKVQQGASAAGLTVVPRAR